MERDHLNNAIELVSSGNDDALLYAVLELRLAIERHVYEKLTFYSKRHGTKLLFAKWQPNKAIKTLCQLEPQADKSYTLKFALESEDGKPKEDFRMLGRHEALTASWIKKHYNKLGSFLHLEPESRSQAKAKKDYLEEVIEELSRVTSGNLICNIADTVSTSCCLCSTDITCCTSALPDLEEVYCANPICNASYKPEQRDGEWGFRLNAVDFECPECGAKKSVLVNELAIGVGITCKVCKQRYVIKGNQWQISRASS